MQILYDHQIFARQKYGGISKYFCELIKNLPPDCRFELSLLVSDNQYLKEAHSYFKKTNIPIPEKKFKGEGVLKRNLYNLNRRYSSHVISRRNYDLLHPTYFDTYFLKDLRKPFIITVHDLIEFKFKEQFNNNPLMPQMEMIIRTANRIIAISEHTKTDIIDLFSIDPGKIDVIYHGFNRPRQYQEPNRLGGYILFVGKRGGYKNFSTFIKAISPLLKKENGLQLICAGMPFSAQEITELTNLKILEKTKVFGVNEKELNKLYANALAFVYPSLYEGFGMPILEAFVNECPVCLSNSSSFPEVAGDAGMYFDPARPESILNAVEKVIYDADFSNEIVSKGISRLKKFSWKYCSEQTCISYEKTIS